jgi:hypothetical protein
VRILITGAAGFLGSHLSQKMLGMGHSVIGLDDLSTGSERNLKALKQNPNFQFVEHDVRLPYHSNVDFILNFACPASPRHYQSDPVRTIETNFLGIINMLHLARDTGAKLLQASTSEVYGDPAIPYTLPNFNIPFEAKTKASNLRMTITGHGQGNTSNAAEFYNATHSVKVNGSTAFNHNVWKNNCGQNSCANQSGTWTLSRAGWCPGQDVTPIENNLTGSITPGTTSSVGYALQTYTNNLNTGYNGGSHTEPYFRIHAYVVENSDSAQNFSDYLNATASRITAPSFATQLTANEVVKVMINNTGSVDLIQPAVSCFVNGNLIVTDIINTTILAGDSLEYTFSQTVDLSIVNDYTINALVTKTGDANASDDIATKRIFQITGIDEMNKSINISVVPNPNNGSFTLKVEDAIGKVNVTVLDIHGKEVYSSSETNTSVVYQTQINLNNVAKQMYFVKVRTDKGITIQKVSVQ